MADRRHAHDDDPTYLFLARLFWRASTPLISSLLLGGCAGEQAAEVALSAGALDAQSLHCAGPMWRPMSALKLAQPVDFVAWRAGALRGVAEIDAAGTPCATASQPRLCEAELRRLSAQAHGSSTHLVFTQGDTVRALQTLDEKLSLLGAIDTPDEALLVLEHNGVPAVCSRDTSMHHTQVRVREGGYRIALQLPAACGTQLRQRIFDVDRTGTMQVVSDISAPTAPCPSQPLSGGVAGRRPPNLLAPSRRPASSDALGRYFARTAWLEAASVPAFEQLAEELRVLRAPRALRLSAWSAAEDEVRHARDTAALAEHFGARPQTPKLSRRRLRGRAEVALDNALEGCAHETYAAYLATAQARLARSPRLREPLRRIARDETSHAALAWQIAAWIEPQLPASARRYVTARREQALRALGT